MSRYSSSISLLLSRFRQAVRKPSGTTLWALLFCSVFIGRSSPPVWADQTISTAVTGPVYGDNAAIFVTATGEVTNPIGGSAILTSATNTVTALTNAGLISAYDYGINNVANTIGTIVNSGSLSGDYAAVLNTGTVGTFTNASASVITGTLGFGLQNQGTFTLLSNAGSILAYNATICNEAGATIGSLTNSGSLNAISGVVTSGTIGTFTNQTAGSITGSDYGILVSAGGLGMIENSGYVHAYNGLINAAVIGSLTNSGTLSGDLQAIGLTATGAVDSLVNSGRMGGGDQSIYAAEGATFNTLTNSGTITGLNGVISLATTGTISNVSGGLIEGTYDGGVRQLGGSLVRLENAGTITGDTGIETAANVATIANLDGGTITGASSGLYLGDATKVIGTLSNAGTIQGNNAVMSYTAVTALTNTAVISGTGDWGIYSGGSIGSLTNSGTIQGVNYGAIGGTGTIGLLTNSGAIVSDKIAVDNSGPLATLVNSGTISGGDRGVRNFVTLTTLTNSGTVAGGVVGVENAGGSIDTLTNEAGGSITSSGYYGLLVNGGTVSTLSNAGMISGADSGIFVSHGVVTSITNSGSVVGIASFGIQNDGGTVGSLVNTGTIGGIGNYGSIGGGAGVVISSTGVGASIGEVTNVGTINGSITVANQDLVIHGGPSPSFGVFESGTIHVLNGSMTFVDGSTYLDDDVILASAGGVVGQGTMTNQGELILGASRQLDGSFVQSPIGTFTSALLGPSHYGNLVASGTASFDGILNLKQDGLSLAGGQTFTLFSFSSALGEFTSLAVDGTLLASLGGGSWAYGTLILTEMWTTTDMSISVVATVVPEIDVDMFGSAITMVLGALSLLERGAYGIRKKAVRRRGASVAQLSSPKG